MFLVKILAERATSKTGKIVSILTANENGGVCSVGKSGKRRNWERYFPDN